MAVSSTFSASRAKQAFGELLAQAAHGPVAIERHGKVVAVLAPPEFLGRTTAVDERRQAREAQRAVERKRLANHQRIAIELLTAPARRRDRMLAAARKEVERWEREQLCSADYIERWRSWLAKPLATLANLMTGDADGWGTAMRQNSPFGAMAANQQA